MPTPPALKAAGPAAAPWCPSLAPSPGVASSLNWGSAKAVGRGGMSGAGCLGQQPGSRRGQRLAEHRAGAAVRGCALGPAGHQGEQPQGSQGPGECWARQSRARPARRLRRAAPWHGPGDGWQACPVSAAPGVTQPGFMVESQGQPPPQNVPSTCLVLRPELSIGWLGHCPLAHGARCVWPGSGNSLMVSVLLWWARPTVCCGALRFVESHRRDQAGP